MVIDIDARVMNTMSAVIELLSILLCAFLTPEQLVREAGDDDEPTCFNLFDH